MAENALIASLRLIEFNHNFKCPPRFAKCTSLSCGGKCVPRGSPRFPEWCVEVKCTKCRKSWNVCKLCAPSGIQMSRLTTAKGTVAHNMLHCVIESGVFEKGTLKRKADANLEKDEAASTKIVKVDKVDLTELTELLNNPVQSMYLKHEQSREGKKYLTSLQMTKNGSPTSISELDANINILIASLVLRVSKGERDLIAKIMAGVVKKINCDQKNIIGNYIPIPVLSTENEFRRYFDGKFAILNNVPIPRINTLTNGDAYVLPSDFLRLYFSMGLVMPSMVKRVDDIKYSDGGVSEVWQSKKAKDCLKKLKVQDDSCYKILLCEWSDGFDPNNNKSNRGSIHVTTFSMFSENERNDKNLSFVATICSDKSDKKEMRRHIYDDLKKLAKPTIMFDGTKYIKVCFTTSSLLIRNTFLIYFSLFAIIFICIYQIRYK